MPIGQAPQPGNNDLEAKKLELKNLKQRFFKLDLSRQGKIFRILFPEIDKTNQEEWDRYQMHPSQKEFSRPRTDWPGNPEGLVNQIKEGKFDQALTDKLGEFERLLAGVEGE